MKKKNETVADIVARRLRYLTDEGWVKFRHEFVERPERHQLLKIEFRDISGCNPGQLNWLIPEQYMDAIRVVLFDVDSKLMKPSAS